MIEAVIFDWAGTTVDYGSLAPVIAFKKAFADVGIELSDDDIRRDMGMAKWDHIGRILELDDVKQQWEKNIRHCLTKKIVKKSIKVFKSHCFTI